MHLLDNAYLLLGLLAATLYAFAIPLLKTAGERGITPLQNTWLINVGLAVGFGVQLPGRSGELLPAEWVGPLVLGALVFVAQITTVLAFSRGDASLATPALGTKVIAVALILRLGFGVPLSWVVIGAALLTTAGIVILAWPDRHLSLARAVPTLVLSLVAACCWAMFDVLVQIWTPGSGFGRLVPWAMILAAVLTTVVAAGVEGLRRLVHVPRPAVWPLVAGLLFSTGQSVTIVVSIAAFLDATRLNVVYGSRGILAVLVVLLLGRHLAPSERRTPRRTLVKRLIAAVLITTAVAIVVLTPR